MSLHPPRVGFIPWYRSEDYAKILTLMVDADELPPTWEKWHYWADKLITRLRREVDIAEKVEIIPDGFAVWCRMRDLEMNAASRNRYCSELVSRKHNIPDPTAQKPAADSADTATKQPEA